MPEAAPESGEEGSVGTRRLLGRTAKLAAGYLDSLPERPVGLPVGVEEMRAALGGELPEAGEEPIAVVERLAAAADRGVMASSGPRFFGFVVGGTLPAALAADWLATAWDQNAGLYVLAPAASVCEEVAGRWAADLLGLPPGVSFGFVTGGGGANYSALAAARHALLDRVGWDVERRGLYGAPEIEVVLGGEAHVTIHTALQMLGLGRERVHVAAADGQGRMRTDALAEVLAGLRGRPTLVCTQAGNVNTGSFDPFPEIVPLVRAHGAWLHVDGAFGLWAAASPRYRELVAGAAGADSWATDAHKWLNVPYDSGLVFCADPDAHRMALTATASYLEQSAGRERDPFEWTPEFSRRARGFAVWAALRSLGRRGVAELVDDGCARARRFAAALGGLPGVEVLNEVVLNQVLVRFSPPRAATRRRPTPGPATPCAGSRRAASSGSPAPPGRGGRRCGSRSPAGRRRRPTWTARWRRSGPRRGADPVARNAELPLSERLFLRAYPWRRIEPVPWARPRRETAAARIALVTSAGLSAPDQEPFDVTLRGGDWSWRRIDGGIEVATLREDQRSDTFDHGGIAADRNLAFPLDRLRELARAGKIGSVASVHASIMGSITAPGRLVRRTAPEIAEALTGDQVDVALLVPV